jgi:hypothetical protein
MSRFPVPEDRRPRITEADVEAVLETWSSVNGEPARLDEAADLEKWILAGLAQPGTSLTRA